MKITILANGEINDYATAKAAMQGTQYIIACDGGLRHARAMEIFPDIIIGDLDSAPGEYLKICKMKGIPINIHPTQKDDTDLALAMSHALEIASSVLILGALGGRIDHTLANFHVLASSTVPAEIRDENTSIHAVRNHLVIAKEDYQTVTLLPLSTKVTGIRTAGLAYPLNGETLRLGLVRGVSNYFTNSTAEIFVESGVLLVMRAK